MRRRSWMEPQPGSLLSISRFHISVWWSGSWWCCAPSGGGPANLTQTVPIYAYNLGWGLKQLGRSSAVTVLLLLFLLVVCALYFRLLNKWEKEGE